MQTRRDWAGLYIRTSLYWSIMLAVARERVARRRKGVCVEGDYVQWIHPLGDYINYIHRETTVGDGPH